MMRSIKDLPWESGKGWWPLIEKVAAAIDSFNAAHPDSPVEVTQIKQKFGGLRIYHHNTPEDIRQLIDEAIEASWYTCERCGTTEGVTTNLEGYRLTVPVLTPITSPISLKLIGVCSNASIVHRCSLVKCLYPILCRFFWL